MSIKSALSAMTTEGGAALEAAGLMERMIDGAATPAGLILLTLIALAALQLAAKALTADLAADAAKPTSPTRQAAPQREPRTARKPEALDRAA